LLGAAPRKLHVFHEMRRNDDTAVAATAEFMLVHVDRTQGSAVRLPPDILERMQALVALQLAQPFPVQAGRAIRMDRPKHAGTGR
jgi:acyl-CoA thioester hydrolase